METHARIHPYQPDHLPAVVVRYLRAHPTHDTDAAATTFADGARVVDEDVTYRGAEAIRGWLADAASEYTYTTTLTGQTEDEPGRWTVLARLEGDFPGGVADLRFRFRIDGDKIAELVIAP
ncbi:nuclear transport factor 2 family protein [Georgenia wangjunii]|uniref:nuclear transport factor 2 family protein n=1 Tax=Georgenia wangjunii TaxID=3117730 RepID=UPI002F263C54